jgi:hypothetical protein
MKPFITKNLAKTPDLSVISGLQHKKSTSEDGRERQRSPHRRSHAGFSLGACQFSISGITTIKRSVLLRCITILPVSSNSPQNWIHPLPKGQRVFFAVIGSRDLIRIQKVVRAKSMARHLPLFIHDLP